MKVAQNDETNPNTRSVHLSHAPSMLNMGHSPSGHLFDIGPEPGKHSWLIPPFAGITYPCVSSPLAPRIAMLCFVLLCLLYYLFVFPLNYFFPVDLETAADTPVINYIDDDHSFLPEQPGKPPLDQPDIAYSSLYYLH